VQTVTPEKLVEMVFQGIGTTVDFSEIVLSEDFNIKIKLDGDSWTGKEIDYRVARFILDLQYDILGMINSTLGTEYTLKNISGYHEECVVKVVIESGCTDILVKLCKPFTEILKDMTGKEKLLALALVAAFAAGGWVYTSDISAKKDIEIKRMDEETKVAGIELAKKSLDIVAENSRAINALVQKMSPGDTIMINGRHALTKKEVKPLLPEKQKDIDTPTTDYNVDDVYEMPAYNFERQIATIRKNGVREFKVFTNQLPEEDKKKLHEISTAADIKGTFPVVELQVKVYVSEGKIASASIVKLGSKRKDAVDVRDAIRASLGK